MTDVLALREIVDGCVDVSRLGQPLETVEPGPEPLRELLGASKALVRAHATSSRWICGPRPSSGYAAASASSILRKANMPAAG